MAAIFAEARGGDANTAAPAGGEDTPANVAGATGNTAVSGDTAAAAPESTRPVTVQEDQVTPAAETVAGVEAPAIMEVEMAEHPAPTIEGLFDLYGATAEVTPASQTTGALTETAPEFEVTTQAENPEGDSKEA